MDDGDDMDGHDDDGGDDAGDDDASGNDAGGDAPNGCECWCHHHHGCMHTSMDDDCDDCRILWSATVDV